MTGYELLHALELMQDIDTTQLELPVWVYGVEGEMAEAYELDIAEKIGAPGRHFYRPNRIVISP